MAGNRSLHAAAEAKQDEFYTQFDDIAEELRHYKKHFENKVVFCNCDDPYESNFFKYFASNFNSLHLKKLVATCYSNSQVQETELPLFPELESTEEDKPAKNPYKVEITEVKDYNNDGAVDLVDVEYLLKNNKNTLTLLKGDKDHAAGDFRSEECIKLLDEADVVCTNPPFSLFREYVAQLVKSGKKFLIIGNQNAITYKEIFPLIAKNILWLGYKSGDMAFKVPQSYEPRATRFWTDETGQKWRSMGNICWYTNLDHEKRHDKLILYKKYTPEEYPTYDNYDAINVDKVSEIPCDYDGVMGVPITFLDKYNPEQFEIVAFRKGNDGKDLVYSFSKPNQFASEASKLVADSGEPTAASRQAARQTVFQNTHSTMLSDQSLTERISTEELPSATSIPGMIKNAEGKINGKITYARITIRLNKNRSIK